MADDKDKRVPQDAARVNIHEGYEVDYWSEKFGVTPDELRQTVHKIGPLAADVEKALKQLKI